MKGSNSKQNKALNLRLVLSEIVTQGPISRVEISRRTHLTKQTITNLVEELLHVALIEEVGIKKEGAVGKPSKMLCLKADCAFSLAFRVLPGEVEAGLFNLSGERQYYVQQPISDKNTLNSVVQSFEKLMTESELTIENILSVGLSVGQVNQQNLHDYQATKRLQQDIASELQLPVALETTASACAAYQMLYGEAKKLNSFVYVHIGDVVESAVVFDRKIMLGQNGLTGALGDIFVTPETDQVTGELGRLNDFASLSSLKQYIEQPLLTNAQLAQYCAENRNSIDRWIEEAAEPMRIAIHTLESILNCQTIIIGGDIEDKVLDKLITHLRPYIPSIAQYGERDVVRFIKTPNVQQISHKGVATLPIHAALSNENMQTLLINPLMNKTPLQHLLYG
ncbi:ROK family transcriptional regulator [Thalassotalea sp. 1_MG-2023]|uniref:ROK family transcriptional regulator n=1 Tax=Thalassotalea sp. 1_MG-2023 TaxID=3062680 RepID=UPI0026E44980|nr:ROK family transcriptional regulator [Thalassotalea sp. 1_MG-2023]MDO6425884.1 ROK family transcriptional regulator [Thalassotalea sp. 1_MG-2023]